MGRPPFSSHTRTSLLTLGRVDGNVRFSANSCINFADPAGCAAARPSVRFDLPRGYQLSALSRYRILVPLAVLATTAGLVAAPSAQATHSRSSGDTPVLASQKAGGEEAGGEDQDESAEQDAKLRDAYYWNRVTAPGDPSSWGKQSDFVRTPGTVSAKTLPARGGRWSEQGPDPIVQVGRTSNSFEAVSGRIGALAIRDNGTLILGAAQGGVWTYNASSGTWTERLGENHAQAVGALAVAPSNDNIVYMGSGEGALSGDSYYGDGFYRSTDGGVTWKHVSTLFTGQAVTAIAVDPHRPDHLYASTVRGRAGIHRTSAPTDTPYGVYESTDGGTSWTLRKGTNNELHGATDVVLDPQNPDHVFASFWGDAIYRSLDGGLTWHQDMTGLPTGDFNLGATRFALGISHPAGDAHATLYTGFDYYSVQNGTVKYHPSQIYKSTDDGDQWAATPVGSGINTIFDYCSSQCYYDNVVKPDPTNPNVVYVLGCYGYNFSPPSGGVFRSTDGGATWKNLGWDLHPDFHAMAFQPTDTQHIAIGNDGGVWESHTGGGRNAAGDPLAAADWQDLNGQVDPDTAALIHSTGLKITQFESMATVPNVPGQYWGGTQDNGTMRKSTVNDRWFDQSSGDGGQAIVDQTTPNTTNPTVPAYVYGEYYGISPYRFGPNETNTFFGNETIDGGIDTSDRSEFYAPWVENRGNTNQMFYGTYRVYRSDNAEAPDGADVTWAPISPDLTSGCTGEAPNGGRGCTISALGVADGGTGVYAGTELGWISVSPDATTSDSPTWQRVGKNVLPARPVNQFAVDRSNWRIAYVAYSGFGADTPGNDGHVFATSDGGKKWRDISGNLPDVPANSIVLDPSDAKTLYVGTVVGTFVTHNGGKTWFTLGHDLPRVSVAQLDYDSRNGVLAAGTHGRGAYTLTMADRRPALVVAKTDSGAPVGPDSVISYRITVRNIGDAPARSVTITDPIPRHTKPVSIADNGSFTTHGATWRGIDIPAGGSRTVAFSVRINRFLPGSTHNITNDGIVVRALGQHVSTTGSPHLTAIAPAHDVTVAPASGTEGAKVGQTATFHETVTNEGYLSDTYALAAGGDWSATVYANDCSTQISTTATVAPGASTDVCVKVEVPAGAADNATEDTTFTATSTGDTGVSASATLSTIAVAKDTLLVDNDTNLAGDGKTPVDSAPYYEDALTSAGVAYSYWDLAKNPQLPQSYVTAHKNVVWFTGNSYPDPVGPYESELQALLDGGGRLFLSGQDILDQAAGTKPFVHDYLHVDWDGTETQNDKATNAVHSVAANPVTDGIGDVPIDHNVLGAAYEDEITPVAPATAAFTDNNGADDALTVADTGADGTQYKVEFLAFPFEAYGSSAQRADLMTRTFTWFNS